MKIHGSIFAVLTLALGVGAAPKLDSRWNNEEPDRGCEFGTSFGSSVFGKGGVKKVRWSHALLASIQISCTVFWAAAFGERNCLKLS
jgi:hypothetical protein